MDNCFEVGEELFNRVMGLHGVAPAAENHFVVSVVLTSSASGVDVIYCQGVIKSAEEAFLLNFQLLGEVVD